MASTSFTNKIPTPANGFTLRVLVEYAGDVSTNSTTITSIKGQVKRNDSTFVPSNTSRGAVLKIERLNESGSWVVVKNLTNTSSYAISSNSYYTWISGSNITVPHLPDGTQNIRVTFSVDGNDAGGLTNYYPVGKATSTIPLEELHKVPDGISYSVTEQNQKLINANVSHETFVSNLSIKQFTFDAYNLYDDTTATRFTIFNRAVAYSSETSNVLIDFTQNEMLADVTETTKINTRGRVTDSLGGLGYSDFVLYDIVPYVKPTLIDTSTTAKRNGQTSGKVLLNVAGSYYNGVVGNVNQGGSYKPVIEYRFWEKGTTPSETWFGIPNGNIIVENGKVTVEGFEIGTTDEKADNYFNYEKSYLVDVRISDSFETIQLINPKSIPVGFSTWTEYRDRVDFKKLTVGGINPFEGKEYDLTQYETLSGITTTRTRCINKMNRVVIDFVIRCTISANTDTTIYTLPEELRPSQSIEFVAIANNGNTKIIGIGFINNNGMLRVNLASALTTSGYLRCCVVYDI